MHFYTLGKELHTLTAKSRIWGFWQHGSSPQKSTP
jgi:hypothetical protein